MISMKKKLLVELSAILKGVEKRKNILVDYKALKDIIGPSGASSRVAEKMVNELKYLA